MFFRYPATLLLTLMITAAWLGGDDALQLLAYQRQAVLNDGQVWRMLTAPLVHFTPQHAGVNLLGVVLLAALMERRSPFSVLILYAASTLLSTFYLLCWREDMVCFAGASALVNALAAALLCCIWRSSTERRTMGVVAMVFLLLMVKLLADAYGIPPRHDLPFVVLWQTHAIGMVCGMVWCCAGQSHEKMQSSHVNHATPR